MALILTVAIALITTFFGVYLGGQSLTVAAGWTIALAIAIGIALSFKPKVKPLSPDKPNPPLPRTDPKISGS